MVNATFSSNESPLTIVSVVKQDRAAFSHLDISRILLPQSHRAILLLALIKVSC